MVTSIGKRSDFERVPRDYYPTPIEAVRPLMPHLPLSFNYIEPCAGDGRLVEHIKKLSDNCGSCYIATDIEPQHPFIAKRDALAPEWNNLGAHHEFGPIGLCITNPPWDRKFLHPFILHWMRICPTWLLFDADWMHTKQSEPFMRHCSKIVSVGRVKWIEGSKNTGKDNCCWYKFELIKRPTEFYGRNEL